MNKWLILRDRIGHQIENLKDDIEKNQLIYDSFDNLKDFLDSYRNGTPKLELLDFLPSEILEKDQVKNLKVIKLQNMKNRNFLSPQQLERNKMLEDRYINILYSKYNYLVDNGIKIKNYINILKRMINLYDKAYSIITNDGIAQICDSELLNAIIDVITELDMDDVSILQMIQELKQKNEELLNNDSDKINKSIELKVNDKEENKSSIFLNSDTKDDFKRDKVLENTKDDIIVKGSIIIRNVTEIIDYFEQVLKCYNELNIDDEKYAQIYARIEYLKQAINDYNESLDIYINSNKMDDEALNYFYNELNHGYDKLLNEKSVLEIQQKFMDTCSEFYLPVNQLKNLIVFIPIDDSEVSNMEHSLDNDENINASNYNSIKLGLRRLLLGDEDALTSHIAKNNNYSEEFLKKYHVKSIKTSRCRIMYSRYSTTLKQKYSQFTESPNVIFIFNAGYGYIDANQKHDLYEGGLKECLKYSNQIDKIRDLLNVDWSKLSAEESEKYDREIRNLFDLQKKKMDHFLNTCILKQSPNDKNKRSSK